jgi:hypothetical protein
MLLRRLISIVMVSIIVITNNLVAINSNNDDYRDSNVTQSNISQQVQKQLNYSINLMWINKILDKEQKFIHPSNEEFVSIICQWAVLNKNSEINVWYDSELSSAEAVKNTDEAIKRESLKYSSIAKVLLKDIETFLKLKKILKFFPILVFRFIFVQIFYVLLLDIMIYLKGK